MRSPALPVHITRRLAKFKLRACYVKYQHILALIATVLLNLLFFYGCGSPSFPNLPSGSYIGEITGAIPGTDQTFAFYAERVGTAKSLLVVIFADGWTPQVLPLNSKDPASTISMPLSFSYNDTKLTLTGSGSGRSYSGEVVAKDGRRGTWKLSESTADKLRATANEKTSGFNLNDWLLARVRYNMVRDELDSLKLSQEEQSNKALKLDRFIKNESVLKDRSKSRKEALTTELNKVTEQRKRSTQDLRGVLTDLALMLRATKLGQLVDLNRRIEHRENRWYGVNWASFGEPENDEEFLEQHQQADLDKLNNQYRQALAVQQLELDINQEKQLISQLEGNLQNRIRVVERQEFAPVRESGNPQAAPYDNPERRPIIEDSERSEHSGQWWKIWDGQ